MCLKRLITAAFKSSLGSCICHHLRAFPLGGQALELQGHMALLLVTDLHLLSVFVLVAPGDVSYSEIDPLLLPELLR